MGACCSDEQPPTSVTIIPQPSQYPPQNAYNPSVVQPQPMPVPLMYPATAPVNLFTNPDDLGYRWVHKYPGAPMPPHAVQGGHDIDGSPIFVGRAYHNGDMVPAKVVPTHDVAYVSFGGQEVPKSEFEVSQ